MRRLLHAFHLRTATRAAAVAVGAVAALTVLASPAAAQWPAFSTEAGVAVGKHAWAEEPFVRSTTVFQVRQTLVRFVAVGVDLSSTSYDTSWDCPVGDNCTGSDAVRRVMLTGRVQLPLPRVRPYASWSTGRMKREGGDGLSVTMVAAGAEILVTRRLRVTAERRWLDQDTYGTTDAWAVGAALRVF